MSNSQTSDYKRRLRREIAGYFIVIMCALPVRFWIMSKFAGAEEGFGFFWNHYLSGISLGLIAAVFVSRLRLRYKLALTGLLVAL
jgi:hypothetical protein